jgi:HSP20 family protein
MEPWGLEVEDRGREVVVRAELPGFEASALDVQLAGNRLTIRADLGEEAGEKSPAAVERRPGRLVRTVTLPEGIEPEGLTVRYRNGALEVHVPKSAEAQPGRVGAKA